MRYLDKSFIVGPLTQIYRDNYVKIFPPKEEKKEKK